MKKVNTVVKAGKKDLFASAADLEAFVTTVLPHMKDTGIAKHLRKVKPDPISKGKGIIIWYGNPSSMSVTELRVTVNLGVKNITDPMWDEIAPTTEKQLKDAHAALYSKEVKQEKKTAKVKKVKVVAEPVVAEVVA